jgi:hypothetical protein
MTEVLHDQNEQRNPRPIGRFLLGMEGFEGRYDPIEFASSFARSGDRFQKHKHKSVRVDGEEVLIDGRKVEVEFKISRYAYIWRIIVFAEKHLTEHLSTNYQPHGGETYELHCAVPKSSGTYAEYGAQRNIIRQREFNEDSQLAILQGVVERVVRLSYD